MTSFLAPLSGTLPLILMCVSLNTFAQLMMKKGLIRVGEVTLDWATLSETLWKMISSPFIVGGVACFMVSLGLWLSALSRLELGVAYPLTSLGYILTAVLGYWLLGENLTFLRVVGIIVIMIGVYLVSRT